VILDETPPSDPGLLIQVLTLAVPLYSPPPVFAPISSVPAYQHPGPSRDGYIAAAIQNVVRPSATARWRASVDAESGIDAYEYVVGDDPGDPLFNTQQVVEGTAKAFQALGTGAVGSGFVAEFAGTPRSYLRPVTVRVRARNNAGAVSQALTVVASPRDLTPPVGMDIRGRVRPGAIDLFMTKPAYDFESNVLGIEYSIGSSAGATDVRAWPSGVDFAWNNGQSAFHTGSAPTFVINTKNLPQGPSLYVNVRARNTHGGRGGIVVVGPVVIDASAPLAPSIALSKSGANLKIDVTGMQDPESGLAKIEYKVDNRFNGLSSTGWKIFRSVTKNPTYAISYSRTENVSAVTPLNNARVSIRLTNGVGTQTVTSATMPLVFPPPTFPF
jgi:hypothetical protein